MGENCPKRFCKNMFWSKSIDQSVFEHCDVYNKTFAMNTQTFFYIINFVYHAPFLQKWLNKPLKMWPTTRTNFKNSARRAGPGGGVLHCHAKFYLTGIKLHIYTCVHCHVDLNLYFVLNSFSLYYSTVMYYRQYTI